MSFDKVKVFLFDGTIEELDANEIIVKDGIIHIYHNHRGSYFSDIKHIASYPTTSVKKYIKE